jgi:thiamine pyrophosphokinase
MIPCGALIIAADSGYLKAKPLGVIPDILVGDFDSLPEGAMPSHISEVVTAPCEKDETDTMLACEIAIERGCGNILSLGGFGGRCDHELSNIFWLENLKDRGIDAVTTDGNSSVSVIRDETVTIEKHQGYFSVFSLDACTVTLEGCKYPLQHAVLKRNLPYAVSNEITEDYAKITIEGTAILCDVHVRE